jgi:hypothetical protein
VVKKDINEALRMTEQVIIYNGKEYLKMRYIVVYSKLLRDRNVKACRYAKSLAIYGHLGKPVYMK